MKRLLLMRHAKAADSHGKEDKKRLLTGEGRAAARACGQMLVQKGYMPARILCSPAPRTMQTCFQIVNQCDRVPRPKILVKNELYHAEFMTIVQSLCEDQEQNAKNNSTMVIGHNPGLWDLLEYFLGENEVRKIPTEAFGLPTATCVVMDFPGRPLEKASARLCDVLLTREF